MSHVIRPADEHDVDGIVDFEIEIAKISFGDEAITDPAVHRKRVVSALGKSGEIMLVAGEPGTPPLGWAWLSGRRNSLTGAHYGNFRSLAVGDHPDRAEIGEDLLAEVIRLCRADDIGELVGKVHATNLPMRALYRKFDFEAVHLTMRKRLDGDDT
ncbi:GNAT family N-acetyltransferase [Stackebrandtia soli]|uniref:GNAT family N-acetyltransferase n=1 Tax=Stackebrandtia soli TaxID=1892856 RepID=UPI0039E860D3